MKLLIVDDSLMILKHAEAILKSHEVGPEILIAQSGKEAFQIMREQDIDIVVLDIIMPEISGIEVLRKIKSEESLKGIKTIMFSSLVDKKTLQECFELGATDYITKPLEEIEFLARVKSAIKEKELEKEIYRHVNRVKIQNDALTALNEKLQSTQSQLIQQEKLAGVGHLAAGVAHEINNPLGFIISNFTTLKKYFGKFHLLFELYEAYHNEMKAFENEESQRTSKAIHDFEERNDFSFITEDIEGLFEDTFEGLERVSKIVQGLRTFSRVDQIEEYEQYDVNDGIENTLVISKNELKYIADVQVDLQPLPMIEAVGGQINQVILNMFLNAVSAIKEKWQGEMGTVEIRSFLQGEFVYVSIKDNGMGIKDENKRSIFNPFFTTKPTGEGTGLGLSISYDIIVNKHKGNIDVKSDYGEGTEMIIGLPIRHPRTSEDGSELDA